MTTLRFFLLSLNYKIKKLRLIRYARVHNIPLNEAEGVQGLGLKKKEQTVFYYTFDIQILP